MHDPGALHSDWITAIFQDSKKRLWIGADQGEPYLLNTTTGKFFNYHLRNTPGTEPINGVWQFVEDSRGNIWVAAHNGCFRLNNATNHFESMDSLLQMNGAFISGISMDLSGNLWFATTKGIKKLSHDKNILTDKNNNLQQLPLFNLAVPTSAIKFDNFKNMWISSGYERILYRYNFITNKFSQYSFNSAAAEREPSLRKINDAIGQIFISDKGALLVSLYSRGIGIYDYAADTFNTINADNRLPYSLHLNPQNEGSISIMQDHKNNIWIGTDKGINIIDINKPVFAIYKKPSNNSSLLNSGEVSDFLQGKDGDIYASYYIQNGGIARFDKHLNFKKRYLFKENSKGTDNQIWNLFQDKDGIIWAPNQSGTILKLN
ncbi:MAG: two-component regulator propeller domain-containing protein, partial [Ginsengibacter sp.]